MQECNAAQPAPAVAAPPDEINKLIVLHNQRRLGEFLAQAAALVEQYPSDHVLHNLIGIANAGARRPDEAVSSYTRALEIKPDFAEAHNNLGLAYKDLGKTEEAIASYGNALKFNPDFVPAHTNLCFLYDKLNKFSELETALHQARQNGLNDHPQILFLAAKLSSRQSDYRQTLEILDSLPPEKLPASIRKQYYNLRGSSYEILGDFDAAFAQFVAQNDVTKTELAYSRIDPDEFLNAIVQLKKSWTSGEKIGWSPAADDTDDISLTFLVGFPRSGTTLLDTILRGHADITVIEEQHMVTKMRRKLDRLPSIEELDKLTDSEIADLRNVYLDELARHAGSGLNKCVIDKFPLNICYIGLMHRVFPKARIILSLRHPYDCVLSCFVQNFRLNGAMANFLDLDRSATVYSAVMGLWLAYRNALDLDICSVKYEDLVQDLRGTCMRLMEFLGLEWDDKLLDHQATAQSRGFIVTPSSDQVRRPLYQQSIGRWRNYREQMRPVLPILEPWADEFGYDRNPVPLTTS